MGPQTQSSPSSSSSQLASPSALKAAALSPLVAHAPLVVAGGRAISTDDQPTAALPQPSLRLEAYRRWQRDALSSPLLDSVDHTTVSDACKRSDGVTYYSVRAFLSLPSSRLPTSSASASRSHNRRRPSPEDADAAASQPVGCVQRRYSDFARLRTEMLVVVSRLPQCQCSYCLDFLVYLRFHWRQPDGLHKLFGSAKHQERRRKMLEAFLNDVVELAQAPVLKFQQRRGASCGTRERVQALLSAFLLEE